MPDNKKYIIEIEGIEGQAVKDANWWAEKKDSLYAKYPDAHVFEVADYDENDTNENDQYLIGIPGIEGTAVKDFAWLSEKKKSLYERYPDAKVLRARQVDYWYDKAVSDEKAIEALQGDIANLRNLVNDPESYQYVISNPYDPELSPKEYAQFEQQLAGMSENEAQSLSSGAREEGMRRLQEKEDLLAKTQADYDANPRVVAFKEYAAQMEQQRYAQVRQETAAGAKEYKDKVAKTSADMRSPAHKNAQHAPGYASKEETERWNKAVKDASLAANDPKGKNLNAANAFFEAYDYLLENKRSVAQGAWYNIWESVGEKEYNAVHAVLEKLEKKYSNLNAVTAEQIDAALTKEEKILLEAYFLCSEEEAKTSGAFQGGQIAGESLLIGGEMLLWSAAMYLTGGAAAPAAGASVTVSLGKGAVKIATSVLKGIGKWALKNTLKAAAFTAVAPTTYTHIARKKLQIGDDGRLMDETSDIAKYAIEEGIENFTEFSGEGMLKAFGFAGDALKGTKWGGKVVNAVGNSKFGKAMSWLSNTEGMQFMSNLGFQGLPVEVLEEVEGAVLNEVTGLNSDALEQFFDADNAAAMIIGFAPMTLFGAGASAANMGLAKHNLNSTERNLYNMLSQNYSKGQIDNVINTAMAASTPNEVAAALRPLVAGLAGGGATQEQLAALLDYGKAVASYKSMMTVNEERDRSLIDAKYTEIESSVGDFWVKMAEDIDAVRQVRVAELKDGRTVFVTSQANEQGEFTIKDAKTGQTGFAKESDIAEQQDEQGNAIRLDNTMNIDDFLNGEIMAERQSSEAKRMSDERQAQIDAMKQRLAANKQINLGTEEAPQIVLAQSTNSNGVTVVDETGNSAMLTWEQVGNAIGTPLNVRTDEQVVEQEIADLLARQAERKAALAQKNVIAPAQADKAITEAEQSIEAANPMHIPTNPDGSVDENAFWNENPEGWAEWNDQQNNDGGVDSYEQIAAAEAEMEARLTEMQKLQATSNPANRRKAKAEAQQISARLAKIDALKKQYEEKLMTPEQKRAKVEQAIKDRAAKWQGLTGVKVVVVENPSEIKNADVIQAMARGAKVMAWTSNNEAYVFLPEIDSVEMLDKKFAHEVVAHIGIKQLLGEEGYKAFCEKVWTVMSPTAQKHFLAYPGVKGNPVLAADEYIAHIAEQIGSGVANMEEQTVWQKIVQFFKEMLNSILGVYAQELTEQEILNNIKLSFANLMEKQEVTQQATDQTRLAAREEIDALSSELSPEELSAVINNDLQAAQEAYAKLSASAPVVEPGESSKAFIERKRAYAEQLAAAQAEMEAKQAIVDEAARMAAEQQVEEESAAVEEAPRSLEPSIIETDNGEAMAETDGNGSVRFSVLTYEQGGRDYLVKWLAREKYMDKAEKDFIIATLDQQYELAKRLGEEFPAFGAWSSAEVNVDKDGNPVMSVIKANGDYSMNLDFSLICKKRRPLNALLDVMIADRMLDMRSLNEAEIAKINKVIQRHGFEVACALCFVDSKRYRVVKVATDFADLYNELVNSLIPEGSGIEAVESNYAGYEYINERNAEKTGRRLETVSDAELNWAKVDEILEGVKTPKSVEEKVAWMLRNNPSQRKLVNATDFVTNLGFESVKKNNPELLKVYNAKKGTGGPKASFGDVQYLNDILKSKSFTPKKAYSVGGVRVQSFSDYMGHMFFDYMQMMAELSAKGLPAHAYTKEEAFARIFGMTGMKINMSLVPAVADNGVAPGLDAEGNYVWAVPYTDELGNEIQGQTFPPDVAFELQRDPRYSKNVGIIAVGVSDEHILKMLNDDQIHFVIPYHKSSLNPEVAKLTKIDKYADYTNVQNTRLGSEFANLDKDQKKSELKKRAFDFYKSLAKTKDPKATAAEYLEHCRQNGLIPKYDQFSGHENYYKLLVDFNTYDFNTGEYAPQGPVTMTFPEELESLVKASVASNEELESDLKDKVGRMAEDVKAELGGTRFSARTDEQRQALFDKAKAQFGLTNNFNAAGYMLPDGSLLDFSEANDGGNPNQRSQDHREIEGIIMDEGIEYDSRWMYLADFMNEGAIRLLPEYAGINLMKAPTKEQRQKLFDFIYKYNGEVILEIADERLNNVAYVEYDRRTSPSRIFRDIDGYFNEGIVPQQDTRFSVIGERGAAVDKTPEGVTRFANLGVARQMESQLNPDWSAKENEAALKIKMATGWERGADGKWRYETSDIQMKPIEDWLFNKNKMTLKDIVEPGILLDMYPALGDVEIVKSKGLLDTEAWYNDATNEMKLPFALMKRVHELAEADPNWKKKFDLWTKDLRRDIIHETQHYIQDKEEFARGGNESIVIDPVAREALHKYLTEMDKFSKAYESLAASEKGQSYGKFLVGQFNIYDHRAKEIMKKFGIGIEGYRKLGGEVESRNMEKRSDMSLDERRNSLLASTEDVSRKDQILIDNDFRLMESEVRFSIANADQAIFVSNAAKAVEGIKQEKATPAQWLAMLEKNGGLKAAEDKWMGLSDWLKESDKKTLTKAEVLEFVNEHAIKIEETHYLENIDFDEEEQKQIDAMNEEFLALRLEAEAGGEWIHDAAEIAYQVMANKYGDDFTIGFGVDMGKLYVSNLEAASAITGIAPREERVINEIRLNYTTGGLTNRHEIALTVPTIESWNESDDTHFGDAGDGRAVAWVRFGETKIYANTKEGEEYKAFVENMLRRYHIDEDVKLNRFGTIVVPQELLDALTDEQFNELQMLKAASMEASDKTEKTVLVIDEIQSKRHQEGREKGYRPIGIRNVQLRMQEIEERLEELGRAESESDFGLTDEQYDEQILLLAEQKELVKSGTIPDAPFDKNWHELSMKRMLRYAAEEGYDVIAWTKGAQQAERYDLSQVVNKISTSKQNNEGERIVNIYYRDEYNDYKNLVVDKEGKVIYGDFFGSNLAEIVGKEMALQIMSSEDRAEFKGDGLRIGGEGMKGFYDKMLPAFMNKYGKKWGIKVEDINLPNLEDGLTMHSVPVTEEMKASVMEGQTMFSVSTPAENKYTQEHLPDYMFDTDVRFSLSKNNRQTISGWLNKRGDLTEEVKTEVLDLLDQYNDATLQLCMGKWFAQGVISLPEDIDKCIQAVASAKKAKVNALSYPSPMSIIDQHGVIEKKQKPIDPDTVSTLKKSKVMDDGVVLYDVEESEESRQNLREIINTHYGANSSPWCLLQGDENGKLTEKSAGFWNEYSAVPKRVAFKDGKLLAFYASRSNQTTPWWDRFDRPWEGVPVSSKDKNDPLKREVTRLVDDKTGKAGDEVSIIREEKFSDGSRAVAEWASMDPNDIRSYEKKTSSGRVTAGFEYQRVLAEPGNPAFRFFANIFNRAIPKRLSWVSHNGESVQMDSVLGLTEYSTNDVSIDYTGDNISVVQVENYEENGEPRKYAKIYYDFSKSGNLVEAGVRDEQKEWVIITDKEDLAQYEEQARPYFDMAKSAMEDPYKKMEEIKDRILDEAGLRFSVALNPEVRQEMDIIKATAMVNGNYMKAPNGQPTKLTEDQWALVRTNNFKRWFGDWENDPENASKVVDENGEPMVVYHGTAGSINKFENQQRSPGFWFVDREDVANGYAESASTEFEKEKNVVPVFLNIRNPRMEDARGEYPAEFALKSFVENDSGVYEVFDTYEEAEAYQKQNVPDGWIGAAEVGDQNDLVERAKEFGYDGVIMKNMHDQAAYAETRVKGPQTNYVALNPNQIKSATETTGLFSENEDIRFSAIVPHESSMDEIDQMFASLNRDPFVRDLYAKVSDLAHKMNLKIKFVEPWSEAGGANILDKVKYNVDYFNSNDYAQTKAGVLLHELIHSVTVYAVAAKNSSVLTQEIKDAVKQMEAIYDEIKDDPAFDGTYGAESVKEMVSELSNPRFRQKLRAKNLFQRIIDAIKQLLGIDKGTNALDNLEGTLEYMIENFDQNAFDAVLKANEQSDYYTQFSAVTDPAKIAELESGEKIKVYRAMQVIDGKLYPPMSAKVDGKMREPIELGQWEQAEERPDLVDAKGNFKLDKANKSSVPARYNPYIHTSASPLNDQFSSAQSRPNLVTVEVEIPASELTSGYKAEGAKDAVGQMEWKAGVVQSKLSGTRTVILSRWDKPIRIVPDSEVAAEIVKMFDGKNITMPSNVVTPSLRAELEKLGVPFVETDNQGRPKAVTLFSALPTKNDFEVEKKAMLGISMMHGFVPFDEMGNTFRSLINEREAMVQRLASKANKTAFEKERLARLEQDLEAAYRQLEWWENVQADLVPTEEVQPEVSKDMEPQSFEEYLSQFFTMSTSRVNKAGVDKNGKPVIKKVNKKMGVMLTPETLTSEMGWTSGDWAGIRYIVSAKDGMSLDAIAEMIAEDEDAKQFLVNVDTMDIKNAVIDFLQSVGTYAEIRDYVKHQREAQAQAQADFINAQIQYNAQSIEDETGMTVDQYNAMLIEEAFRAAEENLSLLETSEINGNFEELTEDEYERYIEAVIRGEEGRVYEGTEDFGSAQRAGENASEEVYEATSEGDAGDMQGGNAGSVGDSSGEAGGVGQPPIGNKNKGLVLGSLETEGKSVDEIVNEGVQKVAKENADAADIFMAKLRKLNQSLTSLRAAISAQREYDSNTVKIITSLANDLLEGGKLTDMTRGEIKRLLSVIKDATGKSDLTVSVDRLMDIMIANQLRFAKNRFADLLKIKASKVNASGVEAQGKLDVQGQQIMQSLKDGMKASEEVLNEWIAEAENDLDSDSATIRHNAELRLAGYEFARQYKQDIDASEAEEAALREDLRKTENEGKLTKEQLKEYRETVYDAIRENKMARVNSYEAMLENMSSMLAGSVARAVSFREAEQQRVENIHHMANSDMQGMPADEHKTKDSWFWNNSFMRFLLKPLATFDQMLRAFAPKSRSGEGYLWNHFMGGWLKATENEFKGIQYAHERLDAYVRYNFGIQRWSDLFALERKLPKAEVTWWNAGKMETFEVSQGNLLYIYMVNKMADGRMKLRKMGITEEDVDNIVRSIDPRFKDLADWLQQVFLPNLREKYNEVHERLFGAPMAAIDNYFPIRVLANARAREVDLGVEEGNAKPSTITGNIIKRTKNSLALDILGSNAFDVVLGHIEEMERWAAFAEWNKDLNTLLSYKKFRNRVQNMSGIYGAGNVVWNNFRAAAEIAAGVYRPATKVDSIDKAIMNIAKGVTGAKISFRVYTAFKQLLSWPAFISDARADILAKNMINPAKAWKWSMENLPLFEKRWKSRQAGDSRLMETESDWKIWKTKVVEVAGRWGMTPNALVDAVTVAIGARSIYETRLKKYLDYGYSQEKAEEKAKRDATILFNESQQSNESAFLSQVQVDRTVASVVFTVFRNSSMGYQRMYVDAIRNLGRMMKPGYKDDSFFYMTKQMMRDGLTEEQAWRAADRIYKRSFAKNVLQALTFGFIVQLAWNLGPYLPYIFGGDDDDKKDEMVKDATVRALVGGPVEGLAGGNILSNAIGNLAMDESLSKVSGAQLPLASDIENTFKLFENDEVRAYNDLFNLAVQSFIGVNPQTISDVVVAVIDACNGDLETATEAMLCIMRILQVPQSQIENFYIDEIDFKADEAYDMTVQEFAERYAKYKVMRNAPLTQWMYTDEEEKKKEDKYIQLFTQKALEERKKRGSEEAKAWYQYVEGSEYKGIEQTLKDIRDQIEAEADAGRFGSDIIKAAQQKMIDLQKTPAFQKYMDAKMIKSQTDKLKEAPDWVDVSELKKMRKEKFDKLFKESNSVE